MKKPCGAYVLVGCAWVLWMNSSDSKPYPFKAFETKAECEAKADQENDRFARVYSQMIQEGKTIKVHTLWKCLPDTVKP
jgi:hypothetical protein